MNFKILPSLAILMSAVAPSFSVLSSEVAPSAIETRCTLNFRDISIDLLVDAIQRCTGKVISIDPNVRGPFTFVTTKPQTPSELYITFIEFLDAKGYRIIEEDATFKLVAKRANARDVDE